MKGLTKSEAQLVNGFCEHIYIVPLNDTITLWNLQGVLGAPNHGIPSQQKYAQHLDVAVEEGWLEPVKDQEDTYKRIGCKRSAGCRMELQILKDKIKYALAGLEWID
jgi:hypothetical protein